MPLLYFQLNAPEFSEKDKQFHNDQVYKKDRSFCFPND